ncbi:MAG TPA: hypothetical protein PLT35_07575 [Vicinamibacterales bacterium]|nr:hypothetical protein [Vicinamibacterales bacterium]HOQ61561.1 hypothetical protein [Vicinamibacterales bacterium]
MRDGTGLTRRFRNLTAVPSRHHDPVFGRAVHEVFAAQVPDVVALELPPSLSGELAWGASVWPEPAASIDMRSARRKKSKATILPFVPGDSILEGWRLARAHGVEVALVDIDTRSGANGPDAGSIDVPGAELAGRVGRAFHEVADACLANSPPSAADLAREAAMARALAVLMRHHGTVLWIGGMYHWARLVARLEAGDFRAPRVGRVARREWTRVALESPAFYRLAGVLPWMSQAFAADPAGFTDAEATLRLLHAAAAEPPDLADGAPESHAPVDVARVDRYARNLAFSTGVRERAEADELLLAASAVIGSGYASRLYALAMKDPERAQTGDLEALTWEVDAEHQRAGFRLHGEWIALEPLRPARFPIAVLEPPDELLRHAHRAEYEGLPDAKSGEKYFWGAYPPDEAEWESFVGYLLRRASIQDPGEARVFPFTAGLADGVDVRATIRFWHQDHIYVREEQRGLLNVRNGAIDWSDEEDSDVPSGRAAGGWNDPDSVRVGSASRETEAAEVLSQAGESLVTRRRREWSLMTLDLPTFRPAGGGGTRPGPDTFFGHVIEPLLSIKGEPGQDHVYGWLEAMFKFCAGKPFAYYSRYRPSPRIHALAREHRVTLLWQPLGLVPAALLKRNRTFRQLWLSASQWAALSSRLGLGAPSPGTPRRF